MTIISSKSLREEEKRKQRLTEDMKGEESVSGSMPDPDENDTLDAEHEMGLYLKEDEEHPSEAGLGEEVNKAEKERWEDE